MRVEKRGRRHTGNESESGKETKERKAKSEKRKRERGKGEKKKEERRTKGGGAEERGHRATALTAIRWLGGRRRARLDMKRCNYEGPGSPESEPWDGGVKFALRMTLPSSEETTITVDVSPPSLTPSARERSLLQSLLSSLSVSLGSGGNIISF